MQVCIHLDLAEVLLEGSDWAAGYYNGDGIGFFKDVYDRDTKLLEQLNTKDIRKAKDGKI